MTRPKGGRKKPYEGKTSSAERGDAVFKRQRQSAKRGECREIQFRAVLVTLFHTLCVADDIVYNHYLNVFVSLDFRTHANYFDNTE